MKTTRQKLSRKISFHPDSPICHKKAIAVIPFGTLMEAKRKLLSQNSATGYCHGLEVNLISLLCILQLN